MSDLHRARIATPARIISVRPLTREDLEALRARRVQPRVKALTAFHHRVARMVAFGYKVVQIMALTGISYSRLSSLKADPAFQELVAQYIDKLTEAEITRLDEMTETATSNMLRAERQIEDHLDESDESGELLPLKTLLAITSDRADRFGYPKRKEISGNVTIDFAKRIEKAMAASGRGAVIDVKANVLPAPTSISEGGLPEQPRSASLRRY